MESEAQSLSIEPKCSEFVEKIDSPLIGYILNVLDLAEASGVELDHNCRSLTLEQLDTLLHLGKMN